MSQSPGKNSKALRKELVAADISPYLADIERIEDGLRAENLSKSTVRNYSSDLKIFAGWLVVHKQAVHFEEVDIDTARQFTLFLKDSMGMSPNTINGYLASLRKMFAMVQEKEVSKRILPDMVVDTQIPRVPSVAQVSKMLKACANERERLMLAILIATGLRFCELLRLRFCDILRDRRLIYIAQSKGRADGYARLTEKVVLLLTEYCQAYNQSHPENPLKSEDYIFFSEDRTAPEKPYKLRKIYRDIQIRANLGEEPYGFHALRHFFALNLYLQSHDLLLVKHQLRHKTLAATEKYLLLATTMEAADQYKNPGDMAFEAMDNLL